MSTSLKIVSAVRDVVFNSMVKVTYDDGTKFAIILNDGSARCYANDLLDEWLAEGNTISDPVT
jgi:hypothetical protein